MVILRDYGLVERIFREFEPEAVIHLGECPSAPYSMIDREHTTFVQMNNLTTTFNLMFAMRDITPGAHLLKLGTMGEYGTPNVDIPEGFFEVEYRGRKDRMPFPAASSELVPLVEGSWLEQHHVRLQDLGYPGHRCHAGNGLRYPSRRP